MPSLHLSNFVQNFYSSLVQILTHWSGSRIYISGFVRIWTMEKLSAVACAVWLVCIGSNNWHNVIRKLYCIILYNIFPREWLTEKHTKVIIHAEVFYIHTSVNHTRASSSSDWEEWLRYSSISSISRNSLYPWAMKLSCQMLSEGKSTVPCKSHPLDLGM